MSTRPAQRRQRTRLRNNRRRQVSSAVPQQHKFPAEFAEDKCYSAVAILGAWLEPQTLRLHVRCRIERRRDYRVIQTPRVEFR